MNPDPVPTSLRAALALLVAAIAVGLPAALASASSPAGTEPAVPLLPDLVTMKIHHGDLKVESSGKRILLRLTNEVANRGSGPLEIFPSHDSHNCDGDANPKNDRDAYQRIFFDNGDGVFHRATDTGSEQFKFGCDRYDPRVAHWNVFDLARYELLRLHGGKVVAERGKVAFCTIDSEHRFPNLPGSPTSPYYPQGICNQRSTLGVSVGWADEYYYGLPNQDLNVTGLRRGRYCFVSSADPDNELREYNNSNNTRRTRIRLNPAKRRAAVLPGRCPIG